MAFLIKGNNGGYWVNDSLLPTAQLKKHYYTQYIKMAVDEVAGLVGTMVRRSPTNRTVASSNPGAD